MTNKVLASFENADRSLCVDIFIREDKTFGFEEYRGESDGGARWQSLNKYSALVFPSGETALSAAQQHVQWLDKSVAWRW